MFTADIEAQSVGGRYVWTYKHACGAALVPYVGLEHNHDQYRLMPDFACMRRMAETYISAARFTRRLSVQLVGFGCQTYYTNWG